MQLHMGHATQYILPFHFPIITVIVGLPSHEDFSLYAATVTIEGPSEVAIGTNLTISCRAITNSFALIHFVHSGTILTSTSDGGVRITTGTSRSSLAIYNVDQDQAGTYSCVVNTGSEGGTAVAELNVTVREGE